VPCTTAVDKPPVTTAEIHVDDELLDEYLLRRTDEYASAAVAQHLVECAECMGRWIELVELRWVLGVTGTGTIGKHRPHHRSN
jgi:hypothetical protein